MDLLGNYGIIDFGSFTNVDIWGSAMDLWSSQMEQQLIKKGGVL